MFIRVPKVNNCFIPLGNGCWVLWINFHKINGHHRSFIYLQKLQVYSFPWNWLAQSNMLLRGDGMYIQFNLCSMTKSTLVSYVCYLQCLWSSQARIQKFLKGLYEGWEVSWKKTPYVDTHFLLFTYLS